MAYSPNNPDGQATSVNSAPVVVASDNIVSTDLDQDRVLHDITMAVQSIAAAKGIASDLRVYVDNASANSVPVSVQGYSNLGGQMGVGGTNNMYWPSMIPQNLQNSAYSNAFSQNITRP